jgi:hypothetical protein
VRRIPNVRYFARLIRIANGATAIVASLVGATLLFAGPAGATSSQIAQFWVHGSRVPTSSASRFRPQEQVEVKVPANSILQPGFRADILMCSDPGAEARNLPAEGTSCDGLTINVGRTLNIENHGAVDKKGYVIYKLPDQFEPKDNLPVCDATHACVLYVGQDQNDFQRPHVWSTPFYVGGRKAH